MKQPTRAERMEMYLFDQFADKGGEFTVHEYAQHEDIDVADASANIQSYLDYQRREDSKALYALQRKENTRTSNAVWRCGIRADNQRTLTAAFVSDVKCRITQAVVPDLLHISDRNPRLRKSIERRVSVFVDSLIPMLEELLSNN